MQLADDFKVVFDYYRQKAKGFKRLLVKGDGDRSNDMCEHCGYFRKDEDHVVLISTPPGYGSIVPCSDASVKNGVPVAKDQATDCRRAQINAQKIRVV